MLPRFSITTTLLLLALSPGIVSERSFVVDHKDNCFRKDGQKYQFISGSMHYYRIPRPYWKDRLLKLKGAGFNTVQTYIPWNLHEPVKGQLDFAGRKDLFSYLKLCSELEILVLLRPGPFIAAEYEFGGFPSWLPTESKTISFRSSEPVYLKNVLTWYGELLPMLVEYLYHNGGAVIGLQVENEYGSNPACDKVYLQTLTKQFRDILGQEILLYTVDGPGKGMLDCGTLPELYNTVDFGGGNITSHFNLQAQYNSGGPPVNTEFYPGWLSHWGHKFPSKSRTATANKLDEMLAYGASVNMYMFHGGSNFGYTSGAKGNKDASVFEPHTTSYDYDAPLSEAGDTTMKYWDIRNVNSKYGPVYDVPKNSTKKSYGKVDMMYWGSVLNDTFVSQCGRRTKNVQPLSLEENKQTNGVIVYSKTIDEAGTLIVGKVRDRAYLVLDGKLLITIKGSSSNVSIGLIPGKLDIIVLSDGHINTGHVHMDNPRNYMKGITEPVLYNSEPLLNWDVTLLPLDSMSCFQNFGQESRGNEQFLPGSIYIGQIDKTCDSTTDTFVDTTGWGKGVVFFQTQNLGRHWPLAGPQLTLYAPGPFCGGAERNLTITVHIVEFEQPADHVTLTDQHNLRGPIDHSQL